MANLRRISRHRSENSISFKSRLEHFTWAWFTLPLSTAGIALLLAVTPHRFDGLNTIGKIFFILALVLYVAAIVLITARFVMSRRALHCSLLHPHEALFFPTSILTLANLIGCAQLYGVPSTGPWLVTAIRVLFWVYMALAFISSALQYLQLFTGAIRLTIQGMTPAWILPIFPVLLGGVIAGIVASDQPPMDALTIIVGGLTYLGMGWMIAFLMYAVFLHRLMEFGLPPPNLRPGMFITAGPPCFTASALIGFGKALIVAAGQGYFAGNVKAISMLQTVANFTAIFLWLFGFWFFCVSLVAVLAGAKSMTFHLIWWALVFPNIAVAMATGRIGEALESEAIMWVASVMTILLVAGWIFVIVLNFLAVIRGDIMWPGKDEDRECHIADKARSLEPAIDSAVPESNAK